MSNGQQWNQQALINFFNSQGITDPASINANLASVQPAGMPQLNSMAMFNPDMGTFQNQNASFADFMKNISDTHAAGYSGGMDVNTGDALTMQPQSNWFSDTFGGMTGMDMFNMGTGALSAYTGYQQMQEVGRRNDIAQGQLDLSRDQWDEKLRVNQAVANQNKGA